MDHSWMEDARDRRREALKDHNPGWG